MAWVSKRKASDGSPRYLANYRDPTGAKRSAGTFRSRPDAERAGHAAEIRIGEGAWVDRTAGKIRFTDYVETSWWPPLAHLELTTKAAYRRNLDAHFLPFFGRYPMAAITPPVVQDWVATAQRGGLPARSIRKCHTMLSSVFKAVHRDRVIGDNPCERTILPKVITTTRETIDPAQFEKLLAAIPERHRVLLLVGIETGMRWGELAALRPRHLDVEHDRLTVQETIVEISKKNSPTGQRYTLKAHPKSDQRRILKISAELTGLLVERIAARGMQDDDLLFPSTPRNPQQPTSRNTFRTKVWRPAVLAAELPTTVRMHDLRHAHASWLLAGGADLKTVMDRVGHTQISTTQRYLHALDSADNTALEAFRRTRDRHLSTHPEPVPHPRTEPDPAAPEQDVAAVSAEGAMPAACR